MKNLQMLGRLVELLKHFQDRFLFEHFGFLLGNQTVRPHSSLLLAGRQPPLARAWNGRTHSACGQKKKGDSSKAFRLQGEKRQKKCQPRKSLAVGAGEAGGGGAGWAAGGAGETGGGVCAEAAGVCAGV